MNEVRPLIKGDKHYFFGYYNKSQISMDNKFALVLEVDFIDRVPTEKDIANILLVNLEENTHKKIAETRAWNFQQGCMLQWMPDNPSTKIIFNDLKNDKLISKILNIHTLDEEVIESPIYDIHSSGKYALTFSFSKLGAIRTGYGYKFGDEEKEEEESEEEKEEGISIINLRTGRKKSIIKLSDLKQYKEINSMNKGRHWIDQPIFSPDGNRICFLHRWEIEGGLFHTRFFTAYANGNGLNMFPDSGFYSHFTWKNDKEILVWCSVSEKFGNLRQGGDKSNFIIEKVLPVYRKLIPKFIRKRVLPIGYYLINVQTNKIEKININNEDGHPSFSKDEKFLITDTYPNKNNYRKLIYYDCDKKKKTILGEFFSLPDKKYLEFSKDEKLYQSWGHSEFRTDLHPRLNFQGDKITFDSVHEFGKRNCYLLDLLLLNN